MSVHHISGPVVSYSINFSSCEKPRKQEENPDDPEPADGDNPNEILR
jgi:hypothetical protein